MDERVTVAVFKDMLDKRLCMNTFLLLRLLGREDRRVELELRLEGEVLFFGNLNRALNAERR